MIRAFTGKPADAMSFASLDRSDKKRYEFTQPEERPLFDADLPHNLATFDNHCVNTHFYATKSKHAYWKKYRVNQPKRVYFSHPILVNADLAKNQKVHSNTVLLSQNGTTSAFCSPQTRKISPC